MQGYADTWRVFDCGMGPHKKCAAQGTALPGHAQQHRALPAHCAGLLPCQCMDQWALGRCCVHSICIVACLPSLGLCLSTALTALCGFPASHAYGVARSPSCLRFVTCQGRSGLTRKHAMLQHQHLLNLILWPADTKPNGMCMLTHSIPLLLLSAQSVPA